MALQIPAHSPAVEEKEHFNSFGKKKLGFSMERFLPAIRAEIEAGSLGFIFTRDLQQGTLIESKYY